MTQPLLSIGIPTYNRAPFLRILLDSLAAAIPPGEERVQVWVSDNNSADDTEEIVAQFQGRLPDLRYTRNKTNIGAEGNLLALAEKCDGTYLWLIGDDDVVCPESIKLLLDALNTAPDYLVLNYRTIKDKNIISRSPAFSQAHDFDIHNFNQVLSQFGLSNGLLTAVAFRRDAFLAVPREDFWHYADIGLSFLVATLSVALGNKGRYLGRPMFLYRANNSDHAPNPKRWTEVYGSGLRRVTSQLGRMGYDQATLRSFHSSMVWKFYAAAILSNRAKGLPAGQYARSLVGDYGDIPLAWAILPAVLAPKFIALALQKWWHRKKFGGGQT